MILHYSSRQSRLISPSFTYSRHFPGETAVIPVTSIYNCCGQIAHFLRRRIPTDGTIRRRYVSIDNRNFKSCFLYINARTGFRLRVELMVHFLHRRIPTNRTLRCRYDLDMSINILILRFSASATARDRKK